MFSNHWLLNLKSGLHRLSVPSQLSARRRRNPASANQASEVLEVRALLSATAVQAAAGSEHGHGPHNPSPQITQIGAPVTYVAGSTTPVVLAAGAQVTDPGNAFAGSSLNVQLPFSSSSATDQLSIVAGNNVTISAGSILYNNSAIGTNTGGTAGAALQITFNTTATQAGVQAVLDQLAYSNSSATPHLGDRLVVIKFTDGDGASTHFAAQEVRVVSPAAITNLGPAAEYVVSSTPVLIAATGQVTDANNAFASSSLNVQFAPNPSATSTDVLSVVAGNGVTISAGSVLYNGTAVGTETGGTAGAALVVTFNSAATQASVQAVFDQVGYSNSSATATAGGRGVVFQFTDGNGSASSPAWEHVRVLSSPAIIQVGPAVNYTAGSAPVVIAGTAQVIDTAGAFASSTLTIQFARTQSATTTNVLSILAGNGITVNAGQVSNNGTVIGTVAGGTAGAALVVTFNATATQAAVQSVLDQVAYSNTSATPHLGEQHVTFKFTDGNGVSSQLARQEVRIVPAGAITQLGSSVAYSKGATPVVLAAGAQVTDANNAFANSTLSVQIGSHHSTPSTDVLSIVAGNGVTLNAGQVLYNNTVIGTVAGGTGGTALTVTFNASATQASVQAVLDQIAYSNTNATVAKGERGISFQFTDGNGSASQIVGKELHIS